VTVHSYLGLISHHTPHDPDAAPYPAVILPPEWDLVGRHVLVIRDPFHLNIEPDRCWHWWRRRTRWHWEHHYATFAHIGDRHLCGPCRRRHIARQLEQAIP
jgi:hypothetical protein